MNGRCVHEVTETVDTRDPLDAGTGPVTVLGRVCVACYEQLPEAWGCPDCEWAEERRLCDEYPTRFLALPCPAHRVAP